MPKCRKCKMEIPRGATKCPYCGSNQGISCSGLLGALVFLGILVFILSRLIGGSSTVNRPVTSPASTTAVTKSELELEMEEKGYVWADKSLGLVISEETSCETSQYLTKVTGRIQNVSKTNYSYVQVTFALYDESGAKVGDAWGNISGLNSGETWKFEASYLGKCSKYKFTEVSAW